MCMSRENWGIVTNGVVQNVNDCFFFLLRSGHSMATCSLPLLTIVREPRVYCHNYLHPTTKVNAGYLSLSMSLLMYLLISWLQRLLDNFYSSNDRMKSHSTLR